MFDTKSLNMKHKLLFVVFIIAAMLTACKGKESPDANKEPSDTNVGSLTLSPTELKFDAKGGSSTVTVTCDADWSAVISGSELFHITKTSGKGNSSIVVNAGTNTDVESKSGKLTVKTADGTSAEASIFIAGSSVKPEEDMLRATPISTDAPAKGGTYNINIESNASWTIENDRPSWCKLSATSGTGNATIQVTVLQDKDTYFDDTASLLIKTKNGALTQVFVNKEGRLIDCEGNEYLVVELNNLVWMAENLKCKTFDSQSGMAGKTVAEPIGSMKRESGDYPSGFISGLDMSTAEGIEYITESDRSLLGYSYSVKAAESICPDGWRLPTKEEWTALIEYLGYESKKEYTDRGVTYIRYTKAAQNFKTGDSWKDGSHGYTEFEALPAGNFYYHHENCQASVDYTKMYCDCVLRLAGRGSAARYAHTTGYVEMTSSDNNIEVAHNAPDQGGGCSVRCVKK